MNTFRSISDDFFRLFVQREGKVVLGKRCSTLWLLTAMLTATFFAIAFSNASMQYLSEKMNDPFIRWMDIPNRQEGKFTELENALGYPEYMERFDYDNYQADYYQAYMFFGASKTNIGYLRIRFFDSMSTDLIQAILSDDNLADKASITSPSDLPDPTVGLIVTRDALNQLGYRKAPAYLDMLQPCYEADTLGFDLTADHMAHVPLPVLAVVKRLPSGMDMVASKYLFQQDKNDNTYPFNLNNLSYAEVLHYFVPAEVDYSAFGEYLKHTGEQYSSSPVYLDGISFWRPELQPMYEGDFITLRGETHPMVALEAAAIDRKVMSEWQDKGVYRVYDYAFSPYDLSEKSYLSVYFNSLNHIREFEDWVNDEFHIKIDMSQVNSKENFNAVSIMASILSWAIIVFAIVCIVLFIVNLLQSYFQKVKKNLGTFKAFGVSNRRLILVYVLIVGGIILLAVIIALLFTFYIQESLIVLHILKEGTYSYLSLWSGKTIAAVLIFIGASLTTVYVVMKKLLRHTPGDLVYDRL